LDQQLITTDAVLVLVILLVASATLFKTAQGSIASNQIIMKVGSVVPQLNSHQFNPKTNRTE